MKKLLSLSCHTCMTEHLDEATAAVLAAIAGMREQRVMVRDILVDYPELDGVFDELEAAQKGHAANLLQSARFFLLPLNRRYSLH
jgi:hypothetical protein